jgi:hypothetical protein
MSRYGDKISSVSLPNAVLISIVLVLLVLSPTLVLFVNLMQSAEAEFREVTLTPQSPNMMDSSNSASNSTAPSGSNATSISVESTGISRFEEPLPIPSAGLDQAAQEMPEPLTPNETEISRAQNESESSNLSGIAPLSNKTIAEFNLNSTQGIESALISPPNPPLTVDLLSPPNIVATGIGYEGRNQLNSGGYYPPDPTTAAGPNHVVQMVNLAGQINSKEGNLLRSFALRPFFNAGNNFITDPILLYDNSSNRFFASIVDVDDGSVRLAVSQPSNPLLEWNTLRFKFSPNGLDCPDQAYIAVSSDKLAVGANVFSNQCGGNAQYLGSQHIIVNKTDITTALSNSPATHNFYSSPRDLSGFSERPVKNSGTQEKIIFASVNTGNNINSVKMIEYSGQVPTIVRTVTSIPIKMIVYPPGAIQPESNVRLDTTGRLQSAAMSPDNNNIWLTSMDGCRAAGDNQIRSCIRLIEIDMNIREAAQDFDLASKGVDLIYPALTVAGSGSLVITFGASSVDLRPSLFATGQPLDAAPNTLEQPILIKSGLASNQRCDVDRCRYGDYFGASLESDPSDPNGAWITGQYMSGPTIWTTSVSKIQIIPSRLTEIVLPPDEDADGDGLLNKWEQFGVDVNNDKIIDLDLPSFGANPLHRDLFVEVDYMQFHKPREEGINHVVGNFSKAPVSNPDHNPGIKLHTLVDEEISHKDTTNMPELMNIKNTFFGTSEERADPNSINIISAKKLVYHYAVFVHSQPGTSSSGRSNGIPAMEFIVSLGARGWGVDPQTGHTVGSLVQQEGTFMHEFGHNLGLRHAGDDHEPNYKPNYLSVMNYLFQLADLVPDRPLDYSRCTLPSLNENSLNEPDGIGPSCPPGLRTSHSPSPCPPLTTGEATDWNEDGDLIDEKVREDVNCIRGSGGDGSFEILNGYDDWSNMIFVTDPSAGVSIPQDIPEEITVEQLNEHMIQLLALIYNDLRNLDLGSYVNQDEGVAAQTQAILDNHVANTTSNSSLSGLILSNQPDRFNIAAEALSALRSNMDSSINGTAGDDIITNSTAQREIVPKIDNLIQGLENQIR